VLGGNFLDSLGEDVYHLETPFRHVRRLIQEADLAVGNLEAPLHVSSTPRNKRNLLHSPPAAAQALANVGFNVLNLANNHITDHGREGITRTWQLLEEAGITCFGAGVDLDQASRPACVKIGGLKFAFLGYAPYQGDFGPEMADSDREGCVSPSFDRLKRDITVLRDDTTIICISIHWGLQFRSFPTPAQIDLAHTIIDLGAHIVHGHHPHVLQGIEHYGHGVILYSLGNFVFPSFRRTDGRTYRFPPECAETAAVICFAGHDGATVDEIIPIRMDQHGTLHVLKGAEYERALKVINNRSALLMTTPYEVFYEKQNRLETNRLERQRVSDSLRNMLLRARLRGIRGSLKKLSSENLREALRLVLRYLRAMVVRQ